MPHISLQVSRDEVREAVLAGSLPPQLQAVAEKHEAQQDAVRALVAAAAAGDEARLKVGGSRLSWVGCCAMALRVGVLALLETHSMAKPV